MIRRLGRPGAFGPGQVFPSPPLSNVIVAPPPTDLGAGGRNVPRILVLAPRPPRQPLWGDDDGLPKFLKLEEEYFWSSRHTPHAVPVKAFTSDDDVWAVPFISTFPPSGGRNTSPTVIVLRPRPPRQPLWGDDAAVPLAVVDEDPAWSRPVIVRQTSLPAITSDDDVWPLLLAEWGIWWRTVETWEPPVQAFNSDDDLLPVSLSVDDEYWYTYPVLAQYQVPVQAFIDDTDLLEDFITFDDEYNWTNPATNWLPPVHAFSSDDDIWPVAPPLFWTGPPDANIEQGDPYPIAGYAQGGDPPLIFSISPVSPTSEAQLNAVGITFSPDGTFTVSLNADIACYPIIVTASDTVAINPSMTADQIQALINANPDDTTFYFAPGTYVLNHYISLKQGQRCISTMPRAAILTGNDTFKGAIACDFGTSGQQIRGFIVERFISDGSFPIAGLQVRDQGLIDDCEVRYCQHGIDVNANNTVRGCFIHDNRQYGIRGGPGDNILIENTELSFNNTLQLDPNNDAGGSKIIGGTVGMSGLTWRNCYVHDNYGVGIWTDGNVINALYEDNRIEGNGGAGLSHEISWAAIIRRNSFRNNNTLQVGSQSVWFGGEIALNNSQNVEIYGNTMETTGTNAFAFVNSTRSEPVMFPQFLANISTHDNDVWMRGAMFSGFAGDSTPSGITFTNNHYHTDALARWQDMAGVRTFAQWQGDGFDVGGTNVPWT